MDARCKTAHAKLLAGVCPWCGREIIKGNVVGLPDDSDLEPRQMEEEDQQQGQTLADRIRSDGVLSIEEAVNVIESIAHEVARLQEGSTRCDWLSPSNIRIQHGRITLGLTTFAAADSHAVSANATEVADYLAPELVFHGARADPRTAVYSLGCVLHFVLVGRAPFADGSISERLLKHQVEQPAPLETVRENVAAGLATIGQRMLAKKPEDRFPSAGDVLLAIASWRAEK